MHRAIGVGIFNCLPVKRNKLNLLCPKLFSLRIFECQNLFISTTKLSIPSINLTLLESEKINHNQNRPALEGKNLVWRTFISR